MSDVKKTISELSVLAKGSETNDDLILVLHKNGNAFESMAMALSAVGSGGSGGSVGHTVTIGNSLNSLDTEYSPNTNLYLIKTDGTIQQLVLQTSLRGQTYSDVVAIGVFGGSIGNMITYTVQNGGTTLTCGLMTPGAFFYNAGSDAGGTLPPGVTLAYTSETQGSYLDGGHFIGAPWGIIMIPSDITVIGQYGCGSCLLAGTKILMADSTEKFIEDIRYDDRLATWNFDDGCMSQAKPVWIKKEQILDHYWRNTFKSGRIIDTTGTVAGHRFFNLDTNMFEYNTKCVGYRIKTVDGEDVLDKAEFVEGKCKFYNIITEHDGNCFANGILAGYRYCNLYPIDGMKYVKDNRSFRDIQCYPGISKQIFDGCRLAEVQDDPNNVIKYILETKEAVKL